MFFSWNSIIIFVTWNFHIIALKVHYIFIIMLYLFIILIFNSTSMYLLNKLYYTYILKLD